MLNTILLQNIILTKVAVLIVLKFLVQKQQENFSYFSQIMLSQDQTVPFITSNSLVKYSLSKTKVSLPRALMLVLSNLNSKICRKHQYIEQFCNITADIWTDGKTEKLWWLLGQESSNLIPNSYWWPLLCTLRILNNS